MIDALSIDRFRELVASYGADPDRWPADRRGGAVGCLVECAAARAAWRDAADLDGGLDAVPSLEISSELAARVTAIGAAPGRRADGRLTGVLRRSLPYAAAAAIALVVGLYVPSPFRDAPVTSLQNEANLFERAIDDDANDGLTALALVDVRTLADDETDGGTALSVGGQLADMPLL